MENTIMTFLKEIVNIGVPLFAVVSILLFILISMLSIFRNRGTVFQKKEASSPDGHFSVESEDMMIKFDADAATEEIAYLLEELSEPVSSDRKADAFVGLIRAGYVLIHKMINEGNKYDDCRQYERFVQFLIPEAVDRLNNMVGAERI